MFKLLLLLCLMILAALLTLGGRENGPVRDGLAGKIPPLVYVRKDSGLPGPDDAVVVSAASAPHAAPSVAPAATGAAATASGPAATVPDPAEEAAETPGISAAFAASETVPDAEQVLTLALPAAEGGPTPAPQNAPDPAVAQAAEPQMQYVVGNTVNLRAGPSADTESLTKLNMGNPVLVLPSDTPGWSLIRIEATGMEGYIASRFLGPKPQDGIFTPVN